MTTLSETSSTPLLKQYSHAEKTAELWRRGRLRWLLRPHQRECYDRYREWELLDPAAQAGQFARIFVLDIGRRWGKTTLRVLTRFEDCIRESGSSYRYVTAFQKDVEEIVDDVARVLLETCPDDMRPIFKLSSGAQSAGFYFPNGSVLKLAGLDKNPNALRGRASNGDDLSEAVFIAHLTTSVKNVLYAQYQGRPRARMCLESSAPEGPDSEYDRVFVADAKERRAYYFGTIDDNTSLPESEREEFIRAAGGRDHPDCQREYFGVRVRDPERVIVPEFNQQKHVQHTEMPEHYEAYTFLDPGMSDLLALVFAYWHPGLRRLVVVGSWAEYNAGTADVADQINVMEHDIFGGSQYWNGNELKPNPAARVSDTDLRLIQDLWTMHGVRFEKADKTDGRGKDGKFTPLLELRQAFREDSIVLEPDAGPVLDHLTHGKWNERRTDWERHKHYGHFDCVAALQYGLRRVRRNANPYPPESYGKTAAEVFLPAVSELNQRRGGGLERAFSRHPYAPRSLTQGKKFR